MVFVSLCVTFLLTFFAIVSAELFVFCLSDYTRPTWGSPGAQKEHDEAAAPDPLHALRSTSRPLACNLGLVAPLCYLLPVTARLSGVTWLEDRERENQQEFAHTCEAQNSPGWSGRLRPLLPLWVLLLRQRWCRLLVSGLLWDQAAGSGGHQRKMMRTRPCASPHPARCYVRVLRAAPSTQSRTGRCTQCETHPVTLKWSVSSYWQQVSCRKYMVGSCFSIRFDNLCLLCF